MGELGELIKTAVRPFIICSTWTTLLLMWYQQMEVPTILAGAGAAIVALYFTERSLLRLKNNKTNGTLPA